MQLDIRWPKWWAYALLPPSPPPTCPWATPPSRCGSFCKLLRKRRTKSAASCSTVACHTNLHSCKYANSHPYSHSHSNSHPFTLTYPTHAQHTLSRQNAKRRTRVRNAQIIENSLELRLLPKTEIPCKCDIHSSALIELVAKLIRLAFPACCRQWKPITAKYTWFKSLR